MSESDPELVNDLNTLLHILNKLNEEDIPSICVDENGIYYPTDVEEDHVSVLHDAAHWIVGIDDYVGPIAIYGVNERGEPYVCVINPNRGE